ncbi:hypothetical protein MBBA_1286 [Methanoculleus bourgensis]|jgi:hypothetical protein|uniref:MS2 complete genome n=2 Tax=Methanoculleus bourgensis TaxID=83986 RepID=A0A0X3BL21_9EURY
MVTLTMSELFVLQTPLAELILRAAVIYFFLLIVMRVIGRHEFGQLNPVRPHPPAHHI